MIHPPFEIGAACAHDIPAVERLFQQIVADSAYYNDWAKRSELARYTSDKLGQMLAGEPEAVLIARADERAGPLSGPKRTEIAAPGEIAGFCLSHNDSMGLIWLAWLGVAEGHRRKGVAEALVRHLISRSAGRDAHKIWCDTRIENKSAEHFFQKLGFVVLCELRNHWYGLDYYLWQIEV